MKLKAIIVDLDGCLVNSHQRFKRLNLKAYENQDKEAFVNSIKHYNNDCRGDKVIDLGLDLFDWLVTYYKPDHIFFLTARGSGGYNPTIQWLKDENIWSDNCTLIMQQENLGDFQFSTQSHHAEYKKQEAMKIMEKYDVLYAVDDDEQNCQAFAELKIPTIHLMLPLGRMIL